MTFAGLVLRNVMRQRVRAGLTLLGISLGITTIVALGVITGGLKATAGAFVRSGGSDFMLAQRGAADLSFSTIPDTSVADVRAVQGVQDARGILLYITRAGSNPLFFLGGIDTTVEGRIGLPELVAGRYPAAGTDEVALGEAAAADLGAGVGGTAVIGGHTFSVVGLYRSGVLWETSGAFAPLASVQALSGNPGVVTVIHVLLDPGADANAVASRIEEVLPHVVAIMGAEDYGQVDSGFQLIDAANLAISLLAIVIGGVGVMNTMVMSVFERTREIGVLRAVGWSGARVVRMIVVEALFLCVGGAVVGAAAGVGAAQLVTLVPSVSGFVEPAFSTRVLGQALLVAILVALAGAAYPAFRAVRLTPMDALRYE